MAPSERTAKRSERQLPDPLPAIREALGRLRFGAIILTVHEGRLVQMEVTEKLRL